MENKEKLQNLIKKAFVCKWPISEISCARLDQDTGYLSLILKIHPVWDERDLEENPDLPSYLIAKIPTMSKLLHSFSGLGDEPFKKTMNSGFLMMIHNKEFAVYDFLSKNRPAALKIPKYYYGEPINPTEDKEGIILVEDLSGDSVIPNILEGMTLGQLGATYEWLAELHAFSFSNQNWEKLLDYPKPEMFGDFPTMICRCGSGINEEYPDLFPFGADDMKKIIDTEKCVKMAEYFKSAEHKVIVHGDLWINNIVFSMDDRGQASDKLRAVIDWQMTWPGSPGSDLTRLLSISVSPEVRRSRQNYDLLRGRYYEKLVDLMKANGLKLTLTFDQVVSSYKELLYFGAALTVMACPVQLGGIFKNAPLEKKQDLVKRTAEVVKDVLSGCNQPYL